MSSHAPPPGVKNSNILERIIAFSRNRRLRCECCLSTMLEHPGSPNRWLRGAQEHQQGSQVTPERRRGATKSTRSEAERVPKSTQKEAKRAIESSKAKCVKKNPRCLRWESCSRLGAGTIFDARAESKGEPAQRGSGSPLMEGEVSASGSDPTCCHMREKTFLK